MTNDYTVQAGDLRAIKEKQEDGVLCTIWYPASDTELDMGFAFDFPEEDLENMITLLTMLKVAPVVGEIDDGNI